MAVIIFPPLQRTCGGHINRAVAHLHGNEHRQGEITGQFLSRQHPEFSGLPAIVDVLVVHPSE
jgi:hypothetical protein